MTTGTILGVVGGIANNLVNNALQGAITAQDRRENFHYNELAAENADERQRALYNDFYAPAALLQQYNKAGLSPSLMFGGTPGQGMATGQKGNGVSGPTTPYMPMSLIEAAQIGNIMAQTEKTKEETKNIKVDTERDEIQKEIEELSATTYKNEWEILNVLVTDEEGQPSSLYEMASTSKDVEEFLKRVRETAQKSDNPIIGNFSTTEKGIKQLRDIYINAQRFDWNISVLSSEKVSADFQKEIVQAMQKTDFKNLNAQAAVSYLKANIQTAELTETQKEAWNNLLARLGKNGDTWHDVVVVLGMIFNQAMTTWHMPNIGDRVTNNNIYQ